MLLKIKKSQKGKNPKEPETRAKKSLFGRVKRDGTSPNDLSSKYEDSPYGRAKREWMERYGSYIHQAAMWRLVGIITLLIALVSVCGNIYQSQQRKVIPYIVQVDQMGKSSVNRLAPPVSLPRELVQAELAGFITNWRTVTADFDLQAKMINKLGAFTVGSAKGQLKEWYDFNSPYALAKKGRLVQITIRGLPLPVSKDSWRVEWLEETRSQNGQLIKSEVFEATLSIMIKPPQNEVQILFNPGGILITEVAFSRVINSN